MTDKKVALVTGGTGGIGSEVCSALIRQGRAVIAGYINGEVTQAEKWAEQYAGNGAIVGITEGDVSDFTDSVRMISDVEKRFGKVDILVNCAGITRDSTLKKMEPEDWDAVLRTNLDSVFNVTRQVVEGMTERGFGRIVNIASVNGQKGQFGQTNYSSSKAGIHGFTMALAQEVARRGVTVNTVSPGYIKTTMTDAVPTEIREQIVATIPVGRMGLPEEIARTVAFLTDDANEYITGANVPVNGGFYMSF